MNFEKKEIIGMIHLSGPDVVNKALEEIKIYEEEGLSGIIIENYHGSVEDVIDVLNYLMVKPTTLSVGINILPNEYDEAFELCKKYDFIDFIQLDYIAGKYNNNVELDGADYLVASNEVGRKIDVFGGVWPKYYKPIEMSDLQSDIDVGIFLADAIVVTGSGTGQETPLDKIKDFRYKMDNSTNYYANGKNKPLIVGAGLTPLNVREALEHAQGAIVGSAFKPNGRTHQMVDRDLVRVFMDEVNKILI